MVSQAASLSLHFLLDESLFEATLRLVEVSGWLSVAGSLFEVVEIAVPFPQEFFGEVFNDDDKDNSGD